MQTTDTQATIPRHRRVLYGLTNWGLFVAGMVNLGVGTFSAVRGQATIAATSLTAGLVLLFAATIDRFESVKGLGIEAKTRRLDEKIQQADTAIQRLRELAELTGSSLIELNSKIGRWDSAPGPRESYALARQVRSIMDTLGSTVPAIAATLRPWATVLCRDLGATLTKPMQKAMTVEVQNLLRRRASIPQPLHPKNPEFLRLNAEVDSANHYISRMQKIYQFELEDFPERLVALFDNVPLLDAQEVRSIQDKTLTFASDMKILRQSLTLSNAEAWFSELEKARTETQS
jgi:hypothetical protein